MLFDEVDQKILKIFYNSTLNKEKNLTSWTLMRKIYPHGNTREHMTIRRKIIKMAELGIIKKLSEKDYVMVKDFVKVNEIPAIKNCLSIKVNCKWFIFET